jgi:hypothetical protein
LDKIRILSKGKNPNDQSSDDSTSTSSIGEKDVDENSKKYLTMASINIFCRTLIILINKFTSQENITQKSIIEFSELVSSDTCSGKKRKNLFGGLFALNVLKCNGFHLTREGVVI